MPKQPTNTPILGAAAECQELKIYQPCQNEHDGGDTTYSTVIAANIRDLKLVTFDPNGVRQETETPHEGSFELVLTSKRIDQVHPIPMFPNVEYQSPLQLMEMVIDHYQEAQRYTHIIAQNPQIGVEAQQNIAKGLKAIADAVVAFTDAQKGLSAVKAEKEERQPRLPGFEN